MVSCPGAEVTVPTAPLSYLQSLQEFTAAVVSEGEVQAGGPGFCAGLSQGGPALGGRC